MANRTIEILRITPLRGPNIWTYRPALEALVDIGDLEDFPSNTLPGLYERLTAWLPTLAEHRCSVGAPGGFLQRLREGTWPAHIMEHVTLELQNLIGQRTGFGKARETSTRGVYKVVVRSRQEDVTRACLHAARDLLMAAIDDTPFDVPATVARLHELADARCLGPSTASIVDAATERGIPSIRLNDGNLVQLGHGARQRRVWTAETDRTSAIAEGISRDKDLTKRLLQSCGVPVPEGQVVASPEEAWEAAQDIGLPVVVKPSDGNHGRGVSIELSDADEIRAAFAVADAEGSEVIVERHIQGDEHRLLVVGGKLVAATRGDSLWIEGDGESTVAQLIDTQINCDPRRGEAEEFPLEPIVLEREPTTRLLLSRQGLDGDAVPATGQMVLIQRNGNMANDVTDRVHPEVAAAVALAARVVGLDIAGIDLVAEDISRPLDVQRGAIVEVNAGPSLLMHLKPVTGEPRPVGQAIVEHLFPEEDSGRIPIVGISGTRGTTMVARLVGRLIKLSGKKLGMACRDGLYFEHRRVEAGNCSRWSWARRVLLNRSVEAAVFENDGADILAEGLSYDRCQVGVVTRLDQAESLADFDVREPEQVYNVFRTQVDIVLPEGAAVLNAEDPLVARMASLCDGEVIFYASRDGNPVVEEHLAQGGRAVVLREGQMALLRGDTAESMVPASCGSVDVSSEDMLAAVAAAWALDLPSYLIGIGIVTFETDALPADADRALNTRAD
ncbi:cyanophycin synthetase [Denitratisoma oestradiolicum]|uniref:Cyanophycin synthetase n=1 Tax=Denitratisoma oestradiolicum TaxID=311182 RepID=A0A6S6XP73_9PROT|nr:cyanophycin synthetase [Denitratisoma oestradiolicum]TWO81085.1 cyanophycin synthetase [Denitratisoma oestradiolicum]CAB1367761.1 Cyanophycin synthetase [Denitratisoma oestradiolicum]